MIPTIRQGSTDGVTTLWADPTNGRHAAGLVFRVGRYDESLPNAGITHLIEHLAMHAGLEASYECNAEVSGRFTTFYMHSADPADIARFLAGVCAGLTRDGSAELEQEKLILRTEAASRGTGGVLATCLTVRYGARSLTGKCGQVRRGRRRSGSV